MILNIMSLQILLIISGYCYRIYEISAYSVGISDLLLMTIQIKDYML